MSTFGPVPEDIAGVIRDGFGSWIDAQLQLPPSYLQPYIREIKAEGRSVLLSSHIFSEVEKLADTVTIVKEGATVESGSLAELRHLTRTQVSVVLKMDASGLAGLPGVHEVRKEGERISFSLDNDAMGPVMACLASLEPVGLTVNPPSLEDLFLSHYKNGDGKVNSK